MFPYNVLVDFTVVKSAASVAKAGNDGGVIDSKGCTKLSNLFIVSETFFSCLDIAAKFAF